MFASLPVVTGGRYVEVSFEVSVALRSPTPLSIPFALDHVERTIATALD